MVRIGNENVWCGDFHGQWLESPANLSLNLAALMICGNDFSLFNSGDTSPEGPFNTLVQKQELPFLVLPWGRELFYDWGHLMAGGLRVDAEIPPMDETDFIAVLKKLRSQCDFLSLAHPYPFFISNLDRIFDEGLLDAIACNTADFAEWNEWYGNRLKKNKLTPIVAELDFHVSKGSRPGLISYMSAEDAEKDLSPVGRRTTLVFCEHLTTKEIYAAVKAGKSCVDVDGRLVGPPVLVEKLETAGYYDLKRKAIAERESLRLSLEKGVTPIEGEPFTLHASYGTPEGKEEEEWNIEIPAPVNEAAQERFYIPVSAKEQCRAVEVMAAQAVRLIPEVKDGIPVIQVRIVNNSLSSPASGRFTLRLSDGTVFPSLSYAGIIPGGKRNFPVFPTWEQAFAQPPLEMTLLFEPEGLSPRTVVRDLIPLRIPYSKDRTSDDWNTAYPIRIDRRELLDPMWTVSWTGTEDSSALIRMLWNEDALYMRAEIEDTALAPSMKEWFIFMGDSLQIGIIPVDEPGTEIFSFYHFLSTRGGQPGGREFCEAQNVPGVSMRIHRSVPYRLPADCFSLEDVGGAIEKKGTHVVLSLKFPWNLLPLIPPQKGARFQIHFILWDNDGKGIKSALQWPRPGCWYQPSDFEWASAELF